MLKKIALIQFASVLHEASQIWESHRPLFNALDQSYDVVYARPGQVLDADLTLAFIASGGVENQFMTMAGLLPRPLILLADGRHNSLAASLEIMSWLRRTGERPILVHGEPEQICSQIQQLIRFEAARRALSAPIGVIGEPSDWLIGSQVDEALVGRRWGMSLRPIAVEEVVRAVDRVTLEAVGSLVKGFASSARDLTVGDAEITSAARIYPALKTVMMDHGVMAATVRCFSLLESLGTTGCLALSRLSDEGMICGCEGDIPALFSMLLIHHLTGEMPFMANPSRIDASANEVLLAHCTIPVKATQNHDLNTHFESDRGVGISGDFPLGPATLFKVGGEGLDEYFVSAADVLPHAREGGLCRTQVRLRLIGESVDYFLRAPLANHHIVVQGDHVDLLKGFLNYGAKCVKTDSSELAWNHGSA